MTWNRVIEDTKKVISFRLGNHSHRETANRVIAFKIKVLVNDDGVPFWWTIDHNDVKSNGVNLKDIKEYLLNSPDAVEALKYLDIL